MLYCKAAGQNDFEPKNVLEETKDLKSGKQYASSNRMCFRLIDEEYYDIDIGYSLWEYMFSNTMSDFALNPEFSWI